MDTTPKRTTRPLKGKGGLVMIGVLAVLGGIIWWVQKFGPPPREPGTEAQLGDFIGIRRPETVSGLDKPVAEIVLVDGGRHVLQIGSAARQSQGLYARDPDDGRVIVVPTFAVEALKNKKPEDFRDKSALPLADVEKARRISIAGDK